MSTAAIITHMNRDHRVSLYDYLAHYAGVELSVDNPKETVELVDVRLDKLTLNYIKDGVLRSTIIPLSPPMASLSEARNRFISMAFTAADARKVSPYRIERYMFPKGPRRVVSLALLALLGAFAGVTFNKGFAARFAAFFGAGRGLIRVIKGTFITVAIAHTAELLHYTLGLLRYYRVPTFVRLQYIVATIVLGIPGWSELKREGERLKQHRAEFERRLQTHA